MNKEQLVEEIQGHMDDHGMTAEEAIQYVENMGYNQYEDWDAAVEEFDDEADDEEADY